MRWDGVGVVDALRERAERARQAHGNGEGTDVCWGVGRVGKVGTGQGVGGGGGGVVMHKAQVVVAGSGPQDGNIVHAMR